ncbi:MAG: ABC-2 type transport system ATP-binding protein [Planctomycetota bacterium]|jgi:ABC-2 type transport system ATP-binding protein
MRGVAAKRMQEKEKAEAKSTEGIRIRGLSRSFGEHMALAPIDLDIEAGMVTGLLGPNGSGKSTLMRCLVGLVRADTGEVSLAGQALHGDGVAIRKRCTFAPGELALYGRMRAKDQLNWLVAGHDREACERAHKMARDFDLPLSHRVHSFSHGMKRQLLFCAAMGPRVPVRLLDEISEGLDPAKRGLVLDLLRQDAQAGTTILLSSHHLGEVQRVCDRMIFMRAGRVLGDEKSEAIMGRARSMVQLRLDPTADLAKLKALAMQHGAIRVNGNAQELTLHLEDEDPRRVLVALFSDPSLPPPLRVEYGDLSLEDLYGELYGEDAC